MMPPICSRHRNRRRNRHRVVPRAATVVPRAAMARDHPPGRRTETKKTLRRRTRRRKSKPRTPPCYSQTGQPCVRSRKHAHPPPSATMRTPRRNVRTPAPNAPGRPEPLTPPARPLRRRRRVPPPATAWAWRPRSLRRRRSTRPRRSSRRAGAARCSPRAWRRWTRRWAAGFRPARWSSSSAPRAAASRRRAWRSARGSSPPRTGTCCTSTRPSPSRRSGCCSWCSSSCPRRRPPPARTAAPRPQPPTRASSASGGCGSGCASCRRRRTCSARARRVLESLGVEPAPGARRRRPVGLLCVLESLVAELSSCTDGGSWCAAILPRPFRDPSEALPRPFRGPSCPRRRLHSPANDTCASTLPAPPPPQTRPQTRLLTRPRRVRRYRRLKLLIVDSAFAPLLSEAAEDSRSLAGAQLARLQLLLRQLAARWQLSVLVTNAAPAGSNVRPPRPREADSLSRPGSVSEPPCRFARRSATRGSTPPT